MTYEAYCVLCSGRPPLIFDVAASTETADAFTVYAYCDCGRIYQHDFVDRAGAASGLPIRFIAKPLSVTRVQVTDLINAGVSVHEFDLNDDDVYCEWHDEDKGYDLQGIKREITERIAALVTMATT